MATLAKLKAEYLERATAKIMAMPQADFIKPEYYRSLGDLACQVLTFQARFMTMDSFKQGVDPLLDLIRENDLTAICDYLPDDPVEWKQRYKGIALFSGVSEDDRKAPEVSKDAKTSVSMYGNRSISLSFFTGMTYASTDLDFAEQRVSGNIAETHQDRIKSVRDYFVKQLDAVLGRRYVITPYILTQTITRGSDDSRDYMLICRGPIYYTTYMACDMTMHDKRYIDKMIEAEGVAILAKEAEKRENKALAGSKTQIHEIFAKYLVNKMGGNARVLVDQALNNPDHKYEWRDYGVNAKFKNGVITGTFEINEKIRWTGTGLLLDMQLPKSVVAHLMAEGCKKTPVNLSTIINVSNSPLADATITAAYVGKKGTTLTLGTTMLDVDVAIPLEPRLAKAA